MSVPSQTQAVGDRLLLSPREPLLAGGPAEAFESQLRQLVRSGHKHLVVDLASVSAIDSAGLRALVRGHTSAQRAGGSLRLAAAQPAVRKVLDLSHLAAVFESYESVDAARLAAWPWRQIWIGVGGALLCVAMVFVGLKWPNELAGVVNTPETFPPRGESNVLPFPVHPARAFIELAKLVVAVLVGLLVSAIHQPSPKERQSGRSMEQAQTLLCVSGAMMMIIIGNSLVRAFGIAGAASIIRFRTPVDDPKDVTILFLLMSLGMSIGLGSLAVSGLGTAFLCITLLVLDQVARQSARVMVVEIVANGREFPTSHVEGVFARNQITFEPREIEQSDDVTIKYQTWLSPQISLEEISTQLMGGGSAGVSGVSWERPKRA
jgi:anti-anti-sigma factor